MYTPTAAGHGAKEAPKDVNQSTLDELAHFVEKIIDSNEAFMMNDNTIRMIQNHRTNAAAAGLLALHPRLREHPRPLGLVITALYNQCCSENIIVYPHTTPHLDSLGQFLQKEKVLILHGTVGYYFGAHAGGVVINQGRTGNAAAAGIDGVFINQGRGGKGMGVDRKGTIITLTPTHIGGSSRGMYITPERYAQNPTLKEYVDRLLVLAKNDPLAIEQAFGDGVKITAAIKELVGGGA